MATQAKEWTLPDGTDTKLFYTLKGVYVNLVKPESRTDETIYPIYKALDGIGKIADIGDNEHHAKARFEKVVKAMMEVQDPTKTTAFKIEHAISKLYDDAKADEDFAALKNTDPPPFTEESTEPAPPAPQPTADEKQDAPTKPADTERPQEAEAAGQISTDSVTTDIRRNGEVYDSITGVRFNVRMHNGGTAEEALRQIKEWRRFIEMAAQYGITVEADERLATGQPGSIEFDYIMFTSKTWKNETNDYVEFWRNGKDYPDCPTKNPDEIAKVARDLGVTFEPGKTSRIDGGFILHYTLGNLKKNKDGTWKSGSAWWDYYLNIERVERIS